MSASAAVGMLGGAERGRMILGRGVDGGGRLVG